jgi:hypothetical protein
MTGAEGMPGDPNPYGRWHTPMSGAAPLSSHNSGPQSRSKGFRGRS